MSAKVLSKWKHDIPEQCTICKLIDDVDHMIFKCEIAKQIWKIVEEALEMRLSIAKVIKYSYDENINTTLSYICFYIYKFWLETTNGRSTKSSENIKIFIKKNFLCLSKIEIQRHNHATSIAMSKIYNSI